MSRSLLRRLAAPLLLLPPLLASGGATCDGGLGAYSSDANADGAVNVLDCVYIVLGVTGKAALADCELLAADGNADGALNVLDAQLVLFLVFEQAPSSAPPPPPAPTLASCAEAAAALEASAALHLTEDGLTLGLELQLHNPLPDAALPLAGVRVLVPFELLQLVPSSPQPQPQPPSLLTFTAAQGCGDADFPALCDAAQTQVLVHPLGLLVQFAAAAEEDDGDQDADDGAAPPVLCPLCTLGDGGTWWGWLQNQVQWLQWAPSLAGPMDALQIGCGGDDDGAGAPPPAAAACAAAAALLVAQAEVQVSEDQLTLGVVLSLVNAGAAAASLQGVQLLVPLPLLQLHGGAGDAEPVPPEHITLTCTAATTLAGEPGACALIATEVTAQGLAISFPATGGEAPQLCPGCAFSSNGGWFAYLQNTVSWLPWAPALLGAAAATVQCEDDEDDDDDGEEGLVLLPDSPLLAYSNFHHAAVSSAAASFWHALSDDLSPGTPTTLAMLAPTDAGGGRELRDAHAR
eukprot:scaffold1645_cov252-Prasinococcus_capsulatus_cf.AAC.1